ncbi:MAG: hypothetical protein KGY70_11760 [Bacteroidales bacterium]|nr:hypothetical protein [Bacteroidales bacterium]
MARRHDSTKERRHDSTRARKIDNARGRWSEPVASDNMTPPPFRFRGAGTILLPFHGPDNRSDGVLSESPAANIATDLSED